MKQRREGAVRKPENIEWNRGGKSRDDEELPVFCG